MTTVHDVLELIRGDAVRREEAFLKSFPDKGFKPEPVHFFNHGAFAAVQELLVDVQDLIRCDDSSFVVIPVTDAHYETFKDYLGEYFHFVDALDCYCLYFKDIYDFMFKLGTLTSRGFGLGDLMDFKIDILILLENELCPAISQS